MSGSTSPEAGAPAVLELPPVLDLAAAAPLASAFLARRGAELVVDASRVERLGGQCLQVLLSAALTWKVDEAPLSFARPSAGFLSGLALLGIPARDFVEQELP